MAKWFHKLSFWWHCCFVPRITGRVMWKETWTIVVDPDYEFVIEVKDA